MDATAADDILRWIDALRDLGGDCGGGWGLQETSFDVYNKYVTNKLPDQSSCGLLLGIIISFVICLRTTVGRCHHFPPCTLLKTSHDAPYPFRYNHINISCAWCGDSLPRAPHYFVIHRSCTLFFFNDAAIRRLLYEWSSLKLMREFG